MDESSYLKDANPRWFADMKEARESKGSVVLLHFNIRDLVFDPDHPPASPDKLLPVSDFICAQMSHRDVVLRYTLHGGLEVHNEVRRPRAQALEVRANAGSLWNEVATRAAADPFSLMPRDGRPVEEPAPPPRWRVPSLVFPLLTRVLTREYTVTGPAAGAPDQPRAESAAPATAAGGPPPQRKLRLGVVIDYLQHLAPPQTVPTRHEVSEVVESLQHWSTSPQLRLHAHLVVLLSPELTAVHPELRGTESRITAVPVPRPERDGRAAFLGWLATLPDFQMLAPHVDELANGASGMNYQDLLDFARGVVRRPSEDWGPALALRRAEIIQRESGGLLVPKDSQFGLDSVAGYSYVREAVERLIPRMRQGRADVPGILFVGPPGTGKSFYAAALARDAKVNVVVMRNVRNSFVGESERNFEQALQVARSLAPVVIFVDEIDQQFASRGGPNLDSGVEQRLLGRLLEFMDDKANLGRVIWVAASNRPDLIDPALLSRFRMRLPFLLPDRDACMDLLRDKLPRQVGFGWKDSTWTDELDRWIDDKLVGKCSGRELETVVRTAVARARFDDGSGDSDPVDACWLLRVIRDVTPAHDENEYRRQSLLALQCVQFDSPALANAARTTLPPDDADRVLTGDVLNKGQIAALLQEIPAPVRW